MLTLMHQNAHAHPHPFSSLEALLAEPFPHTPQEMLQLEQRLSTAAAQIADQILLVPTFKGVWYAAMNFALLPLLDTRPDQCPRLHRRSDDGPGRHEAEGLSYYPWQIAPASPEQSGQTLRPL